MPAPSLTIALPADRLPDGTELLSPVDLTLPPGVAGLVGRNGAGKSALLRRIAGATGARLMRQEAGPEESVAGLFGVEKALADLRRALAGEFADAALVDWTLEDRLAMALARVGRAGVSPDRRLGTLSGGQRVRAALAALVFDGPDAILMDEPTNDLDAEGREAVARLLEGFGGVALVASHDRALLGRVDRIVEIDRAAVRVFGGAWPAYEAAKRAEAARAEAELARAGRKLAEVEDAVQSAATAKARTDRQGRRLRASGSQSKMLMDKAKERSESSGGAAARLRDRQAEEAGAALEEARAALEVLEPLAMDIPPSGLAAGRDVLKVAGLRFGYPGGAPILDDVSLMIRGPERVAISGPNGAGKSTLLNCFIGRLTPDTGSVMFNGSTLLGLKPHEINQAGVVRVFQTPEIFSELSLLENVMIPAFAKRDGAFKLNAFSDVARHGEIREKAMHMLEEVGLANDRDKTSSSMSRGDKRRLELAMCLVQDPVLLLLDEPTAGMSRADTNATIDLLKKIGGRGVTKIVIEHDMHVVFSLADRISVLAQGTVIVEDIPSKIKGNEKVQEAYLGGAHL